VAQGFLVGLPQRLFTSTGAPANGWKITTYVAGTTTPLTTYSNGTLTSANTATIVCDASGYFRCFVASTILVKLVVTDENDGPQFTLDNLEPMVDPTPPSPSVTAVPTGGIMPWSTGTAPTGFLLCDGSAVSRATYSDLSTLLAAATPSYPFGSGNGTTTFNVPDMRGKFPLGTSTAGTGSTLGGSGGTIDHLHTGPSHTHTTAVPHTGWGGTPIAGPGSSGTMLARDGIAQNPTQSQNDQTITSSASGTGNTGTANPPFVSLQYIIKT